LKDSNSIVKEAFIMILGELLDLVNKQRRENMRIKTAQKLAIGIGSVAVAGVITGIVFAKKPRKKEQENFS
jgi:hypothetical protein